MAEETVFDFIVVGGGTAERGPDEISHEYVVNPQAAPLLAHTDLVVNYKTTPQSQLDNRPVTNFAGRLLSGSSAANYGAWIRAPAADYDLWAEQVGHSRWTYQELLPYLRRTEYHFDPQGDKEQHGFEGPIHTTSGRAYPLRDTVHDAFVQLGFEENADLNAGQPYGFAPWVENWHDGARQHSAKVFDLSGINVFTNATVAKIMTDAAYTAWGVQLVDGRILEAKHEVVISCGAHKTPQLLMLSGIGPKEELASHKIPQLVDSPAVGRNHFDHLSLHQAWKLRFPERGLAMGSPAFNNPEYAKGFPVEWIGTYPVPEHTLKAAMEEDAISMDTTAISKSLPVMVLDRAHVGLLVAYAPLNLGGAYEIPLDGSHISTGALLYLPTSRGRVTLASSDPADEPVVNPRYYSTSTDKAMLRSAVRVVAQLMQTSAAEQMVESETPPKGLPVLGPDSSDEDIDGRIRGYSETWHHSAGTAAMGRDIQTSVVDAELRVHGVKKLRVADASVFPRPISATPQATIYAIAEVAAELIAQSR
ncbi:MAG: hypothetical protein Q9171_000719 [Xanthocarpia ochracea]